MTYNLSSEKPVSKFAFQTQPAALERGVLAHERQPEQSVGVLRRVAHGGALHVESS
jgi:hypothetical protein